MVASWGQYTGLDTHHMLTGHQNVVGMIETLPYRMLAMKLCPGLKNVLLLYPHYSHMQVTITNISLITNEYTSFSSGQLT